VIKVSGGDVFSQTSLIRGPEGLNIIRINEITLEQSHSSLVNRRVKSEYAFSVQRYHVYEHQMSCYLNLNVLVCVARSICYIKHGASFASVFVLFRFN